MSEINFFSGVLYKTGTVISLQTPPHSEWIIHAKLSHHNEQADEQDAVDGVAISFAYATFRVQNRRKPDDRHAYMRVYMQVPWIGTEFSPPEERSRQAVPYEYREVLAMKEFASRGSEITPSLLAIDESFQGPQGIVPGGHIVHMVFGRIPGIRLADNEVLPGFGYPLHTFFRKFEQRSQRDTIRMHFDKEYRNLKKMGWLPSTPWASNLIWNEESKRL